MSTCGHSLYRPIKFEDIQSIGFTIDENNEESSDKFLCVKIHSSKITKHIEHNKRIMVGLFGFDERERDSDYYYLWLDGYKEIKGKKCYWCFNRYGANGPALDYFLQSLHLLGYKMKVEGVKYNYERDVEQESYVKKRYEEMVSNKNLEITQTNP